jgi:TRAP-type C4-dicarboxylate transport system permease small subunit
MAEDVNLAALDAAPATSRPDPAQFVLDALASLGTIWTFGLMLLICADVVGRSFLNAPITGVAEIAAHSVVAIVFLQIGATIRAGRMARADFLIDRIHAALPGLGRVLELVFLLVGVAVLAFIARAAWEPMWTSMGQREFFGVQGLFTVPTWPFRGLIVLGGTAGALAYLALVPRLFRRAGG